MSDSQMNRRRFLGASSAAGLTLASAGTSSLAQSSNDRIQVGIIGAGVRGAQLTKQCIEYGSNYNARVGAVCDIWNKRQEAAVKLVGESYGAAPKAFGNYRDLLAADEIDAVMIATPEHTHAKMMKDAIEAGKHVYVEKPMGNVLSEVNAALAAAENSDRVVQVGTQRRSWPGYLAAADVVKEGRIGDIVKADIIWNMYSPYRWAKPPEDLNSLKESDIDWEAFLMGKPRRKFNPEIYRSFRLFRDFSSGIIDQWLSHGSDALHILTGQPYPRSLIAQGGLYLYHDYRENPDTVQVALEYGEGAKRFPASFSVCLGTSAGRATQVMGTLGTLEVSDAYPSVDAVTARISGEGSEHPNALTEQQEIPEKPGTVHHMANWLDAIRRGDPEAVYAPVEVGYGHSIACIMAADSLWSGRRKVFDPETRQIIDG